MAVLPTGYGKSLTYQIMLPLARKMKELGIDTNMEGKILVCGPLKSIFEDQVAKLKDIHGVNAAFKGMQTLKTHSKLIFTLPALCTAV